MAKIVILGAGAMGSAFCFPLADSGHKVHLVGTHLDNDWIREIRHTGRHPKLRLKMPDGIDVHFVDQLPEIMQFDLDLLVLGVSSAGVRWAVDLLKPTLAGGIPVLLLTKGLIVENDAICILPNFVRTGLEEGGIESPQVGGVAGPCIASELASGRESSVVFAFPREEVLDSVVSMFDSSFYQIRRSTDMVGVELCAALKNFFAIAVGYSKGLAEENGDDFVTAHNLSAGLFTQAVLEMSYLVNYFGGDHRSVHGLPGVGDLYVTCQAGRNSRLGRFLGRGLRYREILKSHMPQDTVEGAALAMEIGPTILNLCRAGKLDRSRIPLAISLIKSICDNAPLTTEWSLFNLPQNH